MIASCLSQKFADVDVFLYELFLFLPTGNFKGMCKHIDHFPEETDYEADPSEYFLREYI